jgi:hypothetical protein
MLLEFTLGYASDVDGGKAHGGRMHGVVFRNWIGADHRVNLGIRYGANAVASLP